MADICTNDKRLVDWNCINVRKIMSLFLGGYFINGKGNDTELLGLETGKTISRLFISVDNGKHKRKTSIFTRQPDRASV